MPSSANAPSRRPKRGRPRHTALDAALGRALRRAVLRFPRRLIVEAVEANEGVDHTDAPALFIEVVLKPTAAARKLTGADLNRMASIVHEEVGREAIDAWPYTRFLLDDH